MALRLKLEVSRWQFRFPFQIAHGSRTYTDTVLVQLSNSTHTAWGEATLPPYLGYSVDDVVDFLNQPFFHNLPERIDIPNFHRELEQRFSGFMPAKAAVDMALWQLHALSLGQSLAQCIGTDLLPSCPHTYTIGICSPDQIKERIDFGLEHGFTFFKLKLDGNNDHQLIENYLKHCHHPFAVDVNQGWEKCDTANLKSIVNLLHTHGCVLIEQPFHATNSEKVLALRDLTELPLIADESCQRLSDIETMSRYYDGINIKLQKCGGVTEAIAMVKLAKRLGLKVLIGCMSESSIGCGVAEALSPWCDWADLDGPYLITNG